jgi:uncharacterized protein (DUF433 family)
LAEPFRGGYDERMSDEPQNNWKYLAPKPGSFYRQLFVNGRIAAPILYDLYRSEDEPMTPEEIADDYRLPIAAVFEAIAYCELDPPEMRADRRREEALLEATGMNDPAYKYSGSVKRLTPRERARIDDL